LGFNLFAKKRVYYTGKPLKTMQQKIVIFGVLLAWAFVACGQSTKKSEKKSKRMEVNVAGKEVATLGAGCFWCVEAVFQNLQGVDTVISGYTGGAKPNPTYKEICTGLTGHAEVCQITYDPKVISFEEILEVFWKTHDPTTLNRQGNDVGTQYRSSIFYHSIAQKEIAEKYIAQLEASGTFKNKIVTTLEPLDAFYVAEDYHQNYFNDNGEQPYCQFVVRPKVDKFRKDFADRLKK